MEITSDIIVALADRHAHGEIDFADAYGEPGYSTDKKAILFSNWNNWPKHVQSRLERDYELEWSDEWLVATHSYPCKAYRTQPDSYSWTPSYILTEDCEVMTREEIESNPEDYIDTIKNDADKVCMFKIDFEALGFTILPEEYESGWYGTNDSPAKILEQLESKYPGHDIVFTRFRNEQFRSTWQAAIRKQDNYEG